MDDGTPYNDTYSVYKRTLTEKQDQNTDDFYIRLFYKT